MLANAHTAAVMKLYQEKCIRLLLSALVSVLPELMSETEPREALKQILCILTGIAVMALLTFV